MALQHFFVGQRHLGSRLIPDTRIIPGLEVRFHYSHVFFCPHCGEIWGRLLHEKARYHQCAYRPCAKHGNGRLSDNHPHSEPVYFEPDWPKAAIQYEFERFLEQAEKDLP